MALTAEKLELNDEKGMRQSQNEEPFLLSFICIKYAHI